MPDRTNPSLQYRTGYSRCRKNHRTFLTAQSSLPKSRASVSDGMSERQHLRSCPVQGTHVSDRRSAKQELLWKECDLLTVTMNFLARCQRLTERASCVVRLSSFVPRSPRPGAPASLPGPRVVAGRASFRVKTTCHVVPVSTSLAADLLRKRRGRQFSQIVKTVTKLPEDTACTGVHGVCVHREWDAELRQGPSCSSEVSNLGRDTLGGQGTPLFGNPRTRGQEAAPRTSREMKHRALDIASVLTLNLTFVLFS